MNERELRILRALIIELRALREEIHGLIDKSENQNNSTDKKLPSSKQKDYVVAPVIRSIVELPPDLIASYKSSTNKKRSEQKRDIAIARLSLIIQKRTAWAAWAAFGAAIVYAAITAVIAIITAFQWYESHRNFTIDERAWIQLKAKKPERTKLAEYKRADEAVEIINVGKSPANYVVVRSAAEIIPISQAPLLNYANGGSDFFGNLFQNSPQDITIGSLIDIPETQRIDLEAGRSYIVVYATIDFRDMFGQPHWTRYCVYNGFVTNISVNAGKCTDYNRTDSN